jgi:hypothetical protein
MDYSANEIEGLVLKAARGGKIACGLGEDLATATAFLDLDRLSQCPCSDGGAAATLPSAIDLVVAGQGPQTVVADHTIIEAYVAAIEVQTGQTLVWRATQTGGVIERLDPSAPQGHAPLGRRTIPDTLLTHLQDMGSKM